MAEVSGISWTHATWNPWLGCDKIAPECAKCYIGRTLQRQGRPAWGELFRAKSTWGDPAKWQKRAEQEGRVYRVFTCSLSDFFHMKADGWRTDAWKVIRDCQNLCWLILTKRPERILRCLPADWPYPNAWLGVSTGCRQTLNKMDTLRKVPIHERSVRWISSEPLLEDLVPVINLSGFGWVVTGGESGAGAEYKWNAKGDWRKEFDTGGRRTMKLEWAAHLRDATKAAGLPFLFKQITAVQSGIGSTALGRDWHEYPNPPLDLPWADQPHVGNYGKAETKTANLFT